MPEYLMAAEADKIQDLIFRSTHLREVVGGSQLLSRFCDPKSGMLPTLPDPAEFIVNDGGSFRIYYKGENAQPLVTYGDNLAETYREYLGGTLTVAKPVEYKDGFKDTNEAAQKALRTAKMHTPGFTAVEQHPFVAFCVSCGIGLAKAHQRLDPRNEDQQPQYLCPTCLCKARERHQKRSRYFLDPFAKAVTGDAYQEFDWALTPEDVKVFDSRDYVAYILADGNGMGKVFSNCPDKDSLCELSKSLPRILRNSLAEATQVLMKRTGEFQNGKYQNLIPTLPLILAGDDLFALIPAPWALDFARALAERYELNMQNNGNLPNGVESLTMGVAVVICKANYPYYLAHERGEELLSEAKQLGKRLGYEKEKSPCSAITFDIILGSRLVEEREDDNYRPTLKPYWLGEEEPGWGIAIESLIQQRFLLKNLPHRRLSQARTFFDHLPQGVGHEVRKAREAWQKRLQNLLERIAHNPEHRDAAENAIKALGSGRGKDAFYEVNRSVDEKPWHGHALPDLLDAWDFSFSLDKSITAYEE